MADILLVHGTWHGPWCWADFAQRLTERGHGVRAVQLRGHDRPSGRIWHRVRHYVEDVHRAVRAFPAPPVLVGHSLGGLVVQNYLERNDAPGAVLMASVPSGGTIGAVASQVGQHPMALLKTNLLLRLKPLVGTSKLARELFFTPDTAGDRRQLFRAVTGRVVPGLHRHDGRAAAAEPRPEADACLGHRERRVFHGWMKCAEQPTPIGQRRKSSPAWGTT